MGYMGLDSWGASDEAADMAANACEKMATYLMTELGYKTNGYNTDGPINVALFFEGFLLPNKEEFANQECFVKLAKETIVKMGVEILQAEEEEWDDSGNKSMHVNAYKRMVKSLNKFVQASTWY